MDKHAIDPGRKWRRRLLAALLILPLPALAADNTLLERQRAAFLAAWNNPASRAQADSAELRGYLLYPDLQARRLQGRVGSPAADAEIEAFLASEAGAWLPGRRLRASWLDALAARGDWARVHRYSLADGNAERVCHAAHAAIRVAPEAPATTDLALQRWLSSDSQPAACDPVFAWLRTRGLLGPEQIQQRAQLALAAGEVALIRWLARQLPAPQAAMLERRARYREQPRPAIDRYISQAAEPLDPDALTDAWLRYARANPDDSALRLPALLTRIGQEALPDAERLLLQGRLYAATGLAGALSRKPWALQMFRQAPEQALDASTHEWRVRAALWAGDWALAHSWVQQMPEAQAGELRWRYWRARAQEQAGDATAAHTLYADLALQRDYYGFLAADRIGTGYRFNDQPLPRDAALLAAVANDPQLRRVLEFRALSFDADAQRSWRDAQAGRDRSWLIAAAQWAHDQALHMQAVTTLVSAGEWNDLALRYPLPYRDNVERAARSAQLPPAWLYAVMRQESLFRRDAVSPANARGLLQLLPETAAQIARSTGRAVPSASDLFSPEINLPLGAAYLRHVLGRFDNRLGDALGAYNAGPGAVARWVKDRDHDADVWVENIPYNETRGYISRVSENVVTYSWRLGEPVPSLSLLLDQPAQLP